MGGSHRVKKGLDGVMLRLAVVCCLLYCAILAVTTLGDHVDSLVEETETNLASVGMGHHPSATQACACCSYFKKGAACYSTKCGDGSGKFCWSPAKPPKGGTKCSKAQMSQTCALPCVIHKVFCRVYLFRRSCWVFRRFQAACREPPMVWVNRCPLPTPRDFFAGAGKAFAFSVFVDWLGDPLHIGISSDDFVLWVNHNDFVVLVGGIFSSPVAVDN